MSALKIAALALLASAAAGSAQAIEILLPSASFFGGARGYQYNQSFNGPDQGVSHSDLFNDVSASNTAVGGYKVQIAGSTNAMDGGFTIAEAHSWYYFVLLSAFPTDIHVLIDAVTQASGAGQWFAEAEVGINAKDGSLNQALAYSRSCNSSSGCSSLTPNDGGKLAVTLTANKIYSIHMDVNGHTNGLNSAFTAFADPIISFDPAYDMPEGITFQFSGNLPPESLASLYTLPVDTDDGPGGGVGGVPEPATWAMMLVGFGGMGGILRRRRATAAA